MSDEISWTNLPLHRELRSKLEELMQVENEKQPTPIILEAYCVGILCNFVFNKNLESESIKWQKQTVKEYAAQNAKWNQVMLDALKVK